MTCKKIFSSIVLISGVIFSTGSYALDIEGSWQEYEGTNATLIMEKTDNSTQAINDKTTDGDGLTVQKLKIKKKLDMKMKNAKNSTQCGNSYSSSSSKAGVYQSAKVKNLKITQTDGKNNTQAVNCVNVNQK